MITLPWAVAVTLALLGTFVVTTIAILLFEKKIRSQNSLERALLFNIPLTQSIWICERGHKVQVKGDCPPSDFICQQCLDKGLIRQTTTVTSFCAVEDCEKEGGRRLPPGTKLGDVCPCRKRVIFNVQSKDNGSTKWEPYPPKPPRRIEVVSNKVLSDPAIRKQLKLDPQLVDIDKRGSNEQAEQKFRDILEENVKKLSKRRERAFKSQHLPAGLIAGLIPLLILILLFTISGDDGSIGQRFAEIAQLIVKWIVGTFVIFTLAFIIISRNFSHSRKDLSSEEHTTFLAVISFGTASIITTLFVAWAFKGQPLTAFDVFVELAQDIMAECIILLIGNLVINRTLSRNAAKTSLKPQL